MVPVLRAVQGQAHLTMPAFVPKTPQVWLPTRTPAPRRAEPRLMAQAQPRPPVPAPTQEPLPIGPGVKAPVAIVKPEPQYTEEAKQAGLEGEVWLSIVVDTEGVPTRIVVTRPLGLGLDEQAILAVSQWRFRPAEKDGVPVPVKATIAVNFKLL
jgi:protein TonB